MMEVFIANEKVISNKNFKITEELLATSSVILNNVYPASWEEDGNLTDKFYYPKDYSICKIYKDSNLLFCGIAKNSGNISLRPQDAKFCSLQILDFKTFLSEGDSLDFVINEKNVVEAIEMIVDTVSDYGFVLGNINILNGDDVIGAYSTLNKTAYDVFQYLADISQAKWCTRMIDDSTVAIDFYDPTLMPKGKQIDYNLNFFEENEIIDLKYNYATNDYRNKQIVISDKVYSDIPYNEIIYANGFDRNFLLTNSIGVIGEILINGISKTFATNTDKEIGIVADFYYTPSDKTISQNDQTNILPQNTEIIVKYVPLVQGRQIVLNNNEINRISEQTNRNGVIARYETRSDVLSSLELKKIANTYIKYKGTAEINLIVGSKQNLWNVGEAVYFSAPLPELAREYLVKKKTIDYISNIEDVFYTFEMSSSFNGETAVNYFDNQRNKNNGNIGTGEYITRNIDLNNTATIIFQNLLIEEITVDNDNVLNFGLNGPLTK